MSPHSRANRRRTSTRQQRPANVSRATSTYTSPTTVLEDVPLTPETDISTSAPAVAAPSSSRAVRRLRNRSVPEPVDYTKDYRDVGRDLRWIGIWAGILFAVMIALAFSGLV